MKKEKKSKEREESGEVVKIRDFFLSRTQQLR